MSPGGAGGTRWAGLALGLLLGCPGSQGGEGEEPATKAAGPSAPDPEFRGRAHAQALAALRQAAPPALRRIDPVAAAEVEGTPLHPPQLGAVARAELWAALDEARRQAEGVGPELLSPEDGVVLRLLAHALERGRHRLERPPWRDDPGALIDAVEPYLHALRQRMAAGRCEDGCGLAELGPALETGVKEIGAASRAALAAAREDLAALRRELPGLCDAATVAATAPGSPLADASTNPSGAATVAAAAQGSPLADASPNPSAAACTAARPELEAAIARIESTLARAATALEVAPERAWDEPVAPAGPEAWTRRPSRWSAAWLRRTLEDEEAYGLPPARLFEQAELTVARLHAMLQREAAREDAPEEPAIARPFDAAACEAAWAPLRAWVQAEASHLVAELDCAAAPWSLPAEADDAAIVRRMLTRGIVEPTRRAHVAATGPDVALVRGRAAPVAQALALEIAIAAGSGRRTAMQSALREAHQLACLAATAVWIHGELGDDAQLRTRLDANACGELPPLVRAAEARPRAALRGLGLVLLGDGPADAAALDRYSWAPMGLVGDLALPPAPVEAPPRVRIEELGEASDPEAAKLRLEPVEPGPAAP